VRRFLNVNGVFSPISFLGNCGRQIAMRRLMTKKKENANRLNAMKSTGPRSEIDNGRSVAKGQQESAIVVGFDSTSFDRSDLASPRSVSEEKTVTEKQLAANRRNALKSAGPRTSGGKRRSSKNALKHGFFFKFGLLETESPAEYRLMLNDFRDYHRPQGRPENECVDSLAELAWRKRRLIAAENAQISERVETARSEFVTKRHIVAWDISRAASVSGGLLRHTDNPLVLQEAKHTLLLLRGFVSEHGLKKDSWLLKKIYGEDQDKGVPFGLPLLYGAFATSTKPGADDGERRKIMVSFIDAEIERLTQFEKKVRATDERRIEYGAASAIIPDPKELDLLMRHQTHLSRETDRILNRLERLQRARNGQSPVPRVDVEISSCHQSG
jgi:hypothetical protein